MSAPLGPAGSMPGAAPASPASSERAAAGPLVLKLGGRALEAPGAEQALAHDVAALRMPSVIVHGGGAEVSRWCERLSITPRFEDGLRVTDAPTLEVAAAVLAGLVNKRLVARLRAADVDAVGLSALDGGVLEVARHPGALGEVGRAKAVRGSLLHLLLETGFTPVVSSVGAEAGSLLNLNADEVAGALAGALGARALVLLTDVDGVTAGGERVARCDPAGVAALMASGEVQGGMLPKLAAADAAVRAGAARVVIGAWRGPGSLEALLSGSAPSTVVLPGAKELVRV